MNEQQIKEHVEKVKQRVRSLFENIKDKNWCEDDGPWPKTVVYEEEDSPFIKAEFYEDGTVKIWPRQPLNWLKVTFTCPEDMKLEELKEIVKE